MADVQNVSEMTSASSPIAPGVGKDALIIKLDELLEKYLNTLDAYQKAREQLSKQLSSGYMSLAQANFQNRSSSVHYGQDCYDERMQALRKVTLNDVQLESEDQPVSFAISKVEEQHTQHTDSEELKDSKESGESQTGSGSDSDTANDETKEPHTEVQKSSDPIRWFGILVPPALRSAQASFISATEGPVPQLVTIGRDLRCQEIEIGRVRKQIKKL